jgi:hypothetical protein
MLYAILVEGQGPLGSVFSRDEFTDKEVQDTDGDGLPEFVDAWGNPLQFFRWPLLYHSEIQRGQVIQFAGNDTWNLIPPYQDPLAQPSQYYLSAMQQREQDPLDLNQQLVAPAWWSVSFNNNAPFQGYPGFANASGCAQAFEYYFHRRNEPLQIPNAAAWAPLLWDRSPTYAYRRAFYSKFLIVSGGLDGQVGVFLYSDADLLKLAQQPNAAASWALIANENNAMPFSATDVADFTQSPYLIPTNKQTISYSPSSDPTRPSSYDLLQVAQDDISNQNIQTTVAIGGG